VVKYNQKEFYFFHSREAIGSLSLKRLMQSKRELDKRGIRTPAGRAHENTLDWVE